MTERIKLTGEMLTLIFQGFDNDLGNNIGVFNTSQEEKIQKIEEQLQQQILDDQEKVKLFDAHFNWMEREGFPILPPKEQAEKMKSIQQVEQENKRLTEDYNLLNEVNESHIDELVKFDEENINLTEKLEKIEEWDDQLQKEWDEATKKWEHMGSDDHLRLLNIRNKLKEILSTNKDAQEVDKT